VAECVHKAAYTTINNFKGDMLANVSLPASCSGTSAALAASCFVG